MPNDLEKPFYNYKSTEGKGLHKGTGYCDIYNELFSEFRGKDVVVVEMGIGYGGCLQMWKEYFGPKAQIWGLDFHDDLFYEEDRLKCIICDQSKPEDLAKIKDIIPKIDIFIDDGSHIGWHQVLTFKAIFPLISSRGYYCCEDLATNYRAGFEGGYLQENTFVEYCKRFPDINNYTEDARIGPPNELYSAYYMAFYDGMMVARKK